MTILTGCPTPSVGGVKLFPSHGRRRFCLWHWLLAVAVCPCVAIRGDESQSAHEKFTASLARPGAAHWAYHSPTRPGVPPTRDHGWGHNEIDRFVLTRLEAAGVAPSREAERATLVRRLSLDLTGLPPSVDAVDAFLADDGADAYERLVDRLLASPHYGEKMALDWLDLARFGDSTGYQDDGDRPNYPYRDYVIDAFNAGMPFDRFTIENIAGDLLPDATLAQQIASGFNRLNRHNEEGGSDADEFQVAYTVDRANTVAMTWMALTFACAQCHDHKYDPISQREFYEFYAFFNSLEGEIVISKPSRGAPPQVRVPGAEDLPRLARNAVEIAATESRLREIEPTVAAAFENWLQQRGNAARANGNVNASIGAAGGTVARSSRRAVYADTRFDEPLTLDRPLSSGGRLVVVRSVNNDAHVGHVSRDGRRGSLGLAVAEGPRVFASLGLPDGTQVRSSPMTIEHGVEYGWTCRYDPAGGLDDPADADELGEGVLTIELTREEKRAGVATLDLTAAQRASGISLDAFGLSHRGVNDADTPIELFIDEVEYTVARDGTTRRQSFDRDPDWTGDGNRSNGQSFGYDPVATTDPPRLLEQLLALPAERRLPLQVARLREHFVAAHEPELRALEKRLAAQRKEREEIERPLPQAMVWKELPTPRPAYVLLRGDYQRPGEMVERNVPAVFPPLPGDVPRDRLALARWLVSREHPLAARVVANRLWKQFFGAGLVRTPEDFGMRSEPPTHPQLLDWLAVQLVDDGWELKRLQRKIVLSATYRQSSAVSPELLKLDPENRLLARAARFRLSAEEIRDGALAVSGLLTRRLGGPSVYPYQPDHFYRDKEDDPGEWKWPVEAGPNLYRRGIYTFLRRTTPYPPFQTFDAPSRGECTVARSRTNTPLQALVTMNDPTFVEAARALAQRVVAEEPTAAPSRAAFAFRCVLSRNPTGAERRVLEELYEAQRDRYRADRQAAAAVVSRGDSLPPSAADPVELAAWTAVAAVLLNLDETITRE